jgi:hypothetical protein
LTSASFSEFRVWSRELTAFEVQASYVRGADALLQGELVTNGDFEL